MRPSARAELRRYARPATDTELRRALGGAAQADAVLLVHGLMHDERCWHARRFDMARAFEDELGLVAIDVAYDTGEHVSESGLALAERLEALDAALGEGGGAWHLVSHSMGGLVVRSALHQAERAGMRFIQRVRSVFLLGAPNRGAVFAQTAQLAALGLAVAPLPLQATAHGLRRLFTGLRVGPVAPLAPVARVTDLFVRAVPTFFIALASRLLEARSDGIRDLRQGSMLREDWDAVTASPGLAARRLPVPPLATARTYAIAGSISARASPAPSHLVSDGLVSSASAANHGPADELHLIENGRFFLLPGVTHLAMPSSRRVFQTIAACLEQERQEARGSRQSP